MAFLKAIWLISLCMAAASIVLMMVLILWRLVRDAAARRTGKRRSEVTQVLLEALEQPTSDTMPEVRIATRDLPILDDVIGELLDVVTGQMRGRLVDILRSIGAETHAIQSLRHGSVTERRRAARTLGLFRSPAGADALRRALDDPHVDVRIAAAEAISSTGVAIALPDLVVSLRIGVEPPSRRLRKIFRRLAATQVDALLALLRTAALPRVKMLAVDALAHSIDYRAVEAILAVSGDASDELRAEALRGLSVLGHPAALPAVQRGLTDPAWPVRAQAARCAGRIGFAQTGNEVAHLLHDDAWWVRYRAAEALLALGGPSAALLHQIAGEASRAGRIAQLVLAEKAAA